MSGQTMQIARGETLAYLATVSQNGKPVDITSFRLLFKLMLHLSDPDNACIALVDNLGLVGPGAVVNQTQTPPTLGQANVTVDGSATYGLPNVQVNLYGELWVRDGAGSPWLATRITVSMLPRGLQAQP